MTGRKKNPNHVTLWERCKYQFDRTVKGSTAILLLWLAFISALMIMVAAATGRRNSVRLKCESPQLASLLVCQPMQSAGGLDC
jgi:hypothetical protein